MEGELLRSGKRNLGSSAPRSFGQQPRSGGGDVAKNLVDKAVDSAVNNPIEAVAHWRGGKLRPLCVFDTQRMPYNDKMTADMSWHDIPTCKESGLDVHYLMLRGIFGPPGMPKEALDWYINFFRKVTQTATWKKYTDDNALKRAFLPNGPEFTKWLGETENLHKELMTQGGLIGVQKK